MMTALQRRNTILRETVDRVRRMDSIEPRPIQVDAELHRRCNLTCAYCSRERTPFDLHEHSRLIELPVGRWLRYVDESAELGVRTWNIEGANEPTAIPALFWSVVRRIKDRNLFGIVTTNGTLWNERWCEEIVTLGWDRLHVSVEGPDARIHDPHRGRGTFVKTVRTIEGVRRWKKRLKSDVPYLSVNSVLTRGNFRYLPELVELCYLLGVDYFFTEPCIPYTRFAEPFKIRDDEVDELNNCVAEALELASERGIATNLKEVSARNVVSGTGNMVSVLTDGGVSCFKPWLVLAIKADGRIGHCGLLSEGVSSDNVSLRSLWERGFFSDMRAHYRTGKLRSYCAYCCPSDMGHRNLLRKLVKNKGRMEREVRS